MTASLDNILERLRANARGRPGLSLLVLFGSRARGDATARSDWDLGYLADNSFDVDGFLGDIVETCGTDRVDLVDLRRASGLLRIRAAQDGVALFEAVPRAFEDFAIEAALFWCDVEPLLRREYEHYLERLPS